MSRCQPGALALLMFCASPIAQADPSVYEGVCDASAAVLVAPDRLLVAEDEGDQLLLYRIGHRRPLKRFDFTVQMQTEPGTESDIEGAARVGQRIYWITSHGRNSRGKIRGNRYQLFATDMTGNSNTELAWVGSYRGLIRDLLDRTAWERPERGNTAAVIALLRTAIQPAVMKASALAPHRQGLNIEALAALPDHAGLLIGLRNPRYRQQAIVIRLKNPAALMHGGRARFGPPLLLDLQGLGLRSMTYNPLTATYWLIAGPGTAGGPFKLFEWDYAAGSAPVYVRELDFSQGSHPEALVTSAAAMYVLHDEGSRKSGGVACKQADHQAKYFTLHRYHQ